MENGGHFASSPLCENEKINERIKSFKYHA